MVTLMFVGECVSGPCRQLERDRPLRRYATATSSLANEDSGVVCASGPTVDSTSCMLDTLITPNEMRFRNGVAELTTCRVSLAPGGAVYAMSSSVTVTVCVWPSRVTGMGVTMPPSTRPVWSSTIWA
jgi:hypothetical protein